MSDLVHWLKTGQRGARAEFTDSDLLTTLILLNQEPMGRYKLQEKLQLSDSSTKSLLNYGKKTNLFSISSNRLGHTLTDKGLKIISKINEVIITHGQWKHQAFSEKQHYYVIIKSKAFNFNFDDMNSFPSWRYRDISIAYGAEAILLLYITKTNDLQFPEETMNLEEYYPNIHQYYQEKIGAVGYASNFLLITASKTLEVARKSALITAMHCSQRNIAEIRALF